MQIVSPLLWTLISAVSYGLSFPPYHLQWLAWVAQVPFLVWVRRSRLAPALCLAWLFTITVAYTTGDWFPRAVADYYQQPRAVGIAFFFGVSSIMAAPYVMAFAVSYRCMARRAGIWLPLLAAAAWIGHELGRIKLLTGCPWAVFGYSQVGIAALTQVADLTGVYGISFALVAVNAAVAELYLSWRDRSVPARTARRGVGLAAVAAGWVLAYGAVRLRATPAVTALPPLAQVAIVQGNLDLGSQWRSDFYGRNLDVYLRLTHQALAKNPPAVVFWPESAMTFFLDEEPLYQQAIGYVLQPAGVQLVAGGPRQVHSQAPTYFNSAFLLAPEGRILATYDKQDLLPFAEYFPFRSLDFLRRRFERVREFTAGAPTVPLPTAAGRAGVLICNEAMFPEPAAARVAAGAEYLLSPANDSWLGDQKFSAQAFDIVSLRAIEQRRYLVRTSTAGPSAIVDPFGYVVVQTAPLTQAWVRGAIGRAAVRTVYSRFGDLFAVTCLIVSVVGTITSRRRD